MAKPFKKISISIYDSSTIRSGPRGSLCGRGGIQLEIGDLCWPVRRDFAVWYHEDTMAWDAWEFGATKKTGRSEKSRFVSEKPKSSRLYEALHVKNCYPRVI